MREPWLEDPDCRLYHGDALSVLREMSDESVHCIATSPPFYALRDYGAEGQIGLEDTPEEWASRLVEVFREARRVLRKDGTLWIECGDSYCANTQGSPKPSAQTKGHVHGWVPNSWGGGQATPLRHPTKPKDLLGQPFLLAFALRADGWYWRGCYPWAKPNAMPESAKDRCTTAHSYVLHFSRSPRYFFDGEAISEPAAWERWGDQTVPKYEGTPTSTGWMQPRTKDDLIALGGRTTNGQKPRTDERRGFDNRLERVDGLKHPRSVWTIPTQGFPEAHFATWPEALARRIILAGCPESVCSVCGEARDTDCGHNAYRCESCGIVLDSCDNPWHVEYETVRAMRSDDAGEESLVSGEAVLLEEVRFDLDGEESSDDTGLRDRREGLSPLANAGSSASVEGRLHHGASVRDGADPRSSSHEGRSGASQERRQGGQPPRESRSATEADSRPPADASPASDRLPSLRREDHHVGSCPTCDGRLELVSESERFQPGVCLDPFAGSGTTLYVARKLGRRGIGIDLNAEYLEMAARRLQQQSLFSDAP